MKNFIVHFKWCQCFPIANRMPQRNPMPQRLRRDFLHSFCPLSNKVFKFMVINLMLGVSKIVDSSRLLTRWYFDRRLSPGESNMRMMMACPKLIYIAHSRKRSGNGKELRNSSSKKYCLESLIFGSSLPKGATETHTHFRCRTATS